VKAEDVQAFQALLVEGQATLQTWQRARSVLMEEWEAQRSWAGTQVLASNALQQDCRKRLAEIGPHFKNAQRQINETFKLAQRALESAEKTLLARRTSGWDGATLRRTMEAWNVAREDAVETMHEALYFSHQATWLQERFPEAKYADVAGLCKVVTLEEIEVKDSSLTPGRYVGVAPEEFNEEDVFETRMIAIHSELQDLNNEAVNLSWAIQKRFEALNL
jgi:type I restriction enzyme M protein